ncbi:MAG: BatD family protein [Sedimentisphaeraceae bacterium JB056]
MKTKTIIYFLLLSGIWITALADSVSVYGKVDDKEPIYSGQRFNFYVVIDGDNTPGTVDEKPLAPFSPQGPQVRDVSQSSVVTINGKTTKNVVKRYLISYSLQAGTEGNYVIPPLTVTVGGDTYRTSPVNFAVQKPETTNRIAIEAELSEDKCYVGQPVILTVKWYVWKDIAGRVSDYMFNVPVFSDADFIIEDITPTSTPPNKAALQVNGIDVQVNQRAVKYNGNDCVEVSFSKVLIPKITGTLSLDKIGVLCKINMSRSRFGFDREYKSFGTDTDRLTLEVTALPQEDKPDGFYGLIGNFDIMTEATPTDIKVGDPITLKISIGGNPYLKPVQWPELSSIKDFTDNFILPSEQSSPEIVNGRKVFTQTIRAKNDTVEQIPAVTISFFDTEKGKYATSSSNPININVSPTKVLTLSDVESGNSFESGRTLQAVKGGISANYVGNELLKDMSFSPYKKIIHFPAVVIWGGPLFIFIISFIFSLTSRDKDIRAVRKRMKNAAKKARSALSKIDSDGEGAKKTLAAAVKTYFAEKFDKSSGSLTSEDCRRIVEEKCDDHESAGKIAEIIEKCETSEYSLLSVEFDRDWIKEIIAIIERIEKCVR